MNDRSETKMATRRPRGGLGTRGGSIVEYILIAGLIALAAIQGFKQARMRENRTIAYQARIIRTLDATNPGPDDFDDPNFGNDNKAPFCDLQGHCTGPGQCFAKGTLVAAEKGLVAIETLNEGDLIWSRDEATGDFALRPVLHRYVTSGQAVMDLNVAAGNDDEAIRATTGHPFWTTDKGWVSAAELAVNESLFSASGDSVHVAPIAHPALTHETVYNLEIAEFHTYFVGRHGVWVHNATTPAGPGPEVPPCQQPGYVPPGGVPGTIAFAKNAKDAQGNAFPLGGSYNQIKAARTKYRNDHNLSVAEGIGGEIHHVPQQAIWNDWPGPNKPFTSGTGPAIWMETADHAATASNPKSGGDYIKHMNDQKELVQKGDLCGAIQIDLDDVRAASLKASNNANKYQEGIDQLIAYVRSQGKGYECPNLH